MPIARPMPSHHAALRYASSPPRGFRITAGQSPTSEKDDTREDEDNTIAMAPNALGASNRVSNMFRAKRLTCSAKLPLPSDAPPRAALALRLSPCKTRLATILSRWETLTKTIRLLL